MEIFPGGSFPGGNFLGGQFSGWQLSGWNFPGGNFPVTIITTSTICTVASLAVSSSKFHILFTSVVFVESLSFILMVFAFFYLPLFSFNSLHNVIYTVSYSIKKQQKRHFNFRGSLHGNIPSRAEFQPGMTG